MKLKFYSLMIAIMLLATSFAMAQKKDKKPNVLVIWGDDILSL